MNAITPISPSNGMEEELDLPVEAVLTTITDARSTLTFVSQDFAKFTGHAVESLLGAPHKIVRHPDMPRGIFYLLWENLKAERAMCLYIKNRTAEGGSYWSLANYTFPAKGYMSTRIRPSSSLFETMKPLYDDMLNREKEGATPEESAAWFQEQIQALGFPDLAHLSAHILNAEFKARGICDAKWEPGFALMDDILRLVEDMRDLANGIEAGFRRVRGEPVNLRILAGRLEGAGAALGTISQNYDAMAQEMYELLGRLHSENAGALHDMFVAVSHARASQQFALLLGESAKREEAAQASGPCAEIRQQQERLTTLANQRIREIALAGKPIPDICRSLRRRINGLDVVKLLCKVESGRMRDVDSGLDGIIDRLQAFHDATDKGLAELSSKASQIQQKTNAF